MSQKKLAATSKQDVMGQNENLFKTQTKEVVDNDI